ncbi:MAG: hypothetical protein FJ150_05040 [Euryarchaeota archaeon]|nr:hypothetical protein [Euryarchaeota archaeon]
MIGKFLVTWFWMMVIWILLTDTLGYEFVIMGIISTLITSLVFYDYFVVEGPTRKLNPVRFFYGLVYIIFKLGYEIIMANLDVAYRVLHPKMPIKPGIVKIRTGLKRDTGITGMANSITLTPGTLTVDCDESDVGNLYIHWINVVSEEPEKIDKEIPQRFESWLKRIFE